MVKVIQLMCEISDTSSYWSIVLERCQAVKPGLKLNTLSCRCQRAGAGAGRAREARKGDAVGACAASPRHPAQTDCARRHPQPHTTHGPW